ncbi:MAG: PHP domain-containing protein, partial [Chloroflexota bacterium]
MSLETIVSRCRERDINCIALTDHGGIEGAVKLQHMSPFQVIVGEEVLTSSGEIIGLFLTEQISSGLSAEEAIRRIRAQGGLVLLPHPCDRFRFAIFKDGVDEALLAQVDAIEVFNSRSLSPGSAEKARQVADEYNLPASAGSDAHTPHELGNAYVEMPDFKGKEDFLDSLRQGKIFARNSGLMVHVSSNLARLKKQLF